MESLASCGRQPFLSAVVRTQGRRLHTLVEVFTCLAGQEDIDFEVVVVGHLLDDEATKAIKNVIEDLPRWLGDKTRLVHVDSGGRTRPLNFGFANALGEYISILDDDDAPLGNWVSTFRELAALEPGRVLRALAVRQDVKNVRVNGKIGLRAEGPLESIYPPTFNLFEHLRYNQTPPISLAFPRAAFHELHIEFDESLSTTEDWDYLLRVAATCGVASTPTVTSVYRWWQGSESSRTVHSSKEWQRNYEKILQRQDRTEFVLPAGQTSRIRQLLDIEEMLIKLTPQDGGPVCISEFTRADIENWAGQVKNLVPNDVVTPLRFALLLKIFILEVMKMIFIGNKQKRREYRVKIRALKYMRKVC